MLIIELFLHYGAVKNLNHLPKALLLVDVRAVIQYACSPPSRLYFVKAKSLERPERCATRGEEGLEVGDSKKHHSSASLPAITSEMKCWFSFVLIFSKCGRLSANTERSQCPEVWCASNKTHSGGFSALENVFKKSLSLNELTQRWSVTFVRCFEFWEECLWNSCSLRFKVLSSVVKICC